MKIAVLNYQTGRADILENVPDEGELKTYFIEHPIQGAMHKLGQDDDSICFIEAYHYCPLKVVDDYYKV